MNAKHTLLFSAVALSLAACGGSSSDDNAEIENSAPHSIQLSASAVSENQAGVDIGQLSATDADGDSLTFVLAAGADDRFKIDGNQLSLKQDIQLDFESETSISLPITVSDGTAQTTETVTVQVTDELEVYAFASKFDSSESSVSYTGQIARHVLIAELNNYIDSQLAQDLNNQVVTNEAEILAKLHAYYYNPDNAPTGVDVAAVLDADISFIDNPEQADINAISSGKNLQDKIAGNDATGQHKNWNEGIAFVGFDATFMTGFDNTPEGLVLALFKKLASNAMVEFYTNSSVDTPYVTPTGIDLKQLIQKFLLMSVAYSQGTDDYLDDDTEGKGLLSSNVQGDAAYTSLEHQWDEGFGYFGAARDYLAYDDATLASSAAQDANQDNLIDLTSEYNFGQSVNAAKRDVGSNGETDFTAEAMTAFIKGRALINQYAGTELTSAQLEALQGYRDQAVLAWEKAIAATVIHYINDTHADVSKIGTAEFSLADTAKHWSELKGFLLGLQFNPRSPLSDTDFAQVNTLVGNQPVTVQVEQTAYLEALISARDILQAAYGFDSEVVANW
ncbi:DUF4856 domain-containing protein [Gayadomonas joobiniege]|uniref:DUF4856 domain-containing protein n=1 Tax=Gayadomonas joobiniege TaxID=1234606 RepID=UPI00036E63D8|nr:DUF4856 domain-containing protein [Gayadomonas joobiniege]